MEKKTVKGEWDLSKNKMFQASATSSTRTHSGDASSKAFVERSPQLTGRVTCPDIDGTGCVANPVTIQFNIGAPL